MRVNSTVNTYEKLIYVARKNKSIEITNETPAATASLTSPLFRGDLRSLIIPNPPFVNWIHANAEQEPKNRITDNVITTSYMASPFNFTLQEIPYGKIKVP